MKYIVLMVLFIACSKDIKTPEGLLVKFTEDVTTSNMDRDYYYEFTTGKMKEEIENLSDEDFEKYRDLSRVKNAKVDILKKNCPTQTECSLTYIIKYDQEGTVKKEDGFKSEVKKVAKITQVDTVWKINEVSNIKTYHESTKAINALED